MNNVTNSCPTEIIGFTKVYSGGDESIKMGEELLNKSDISLDFVLDEFVEEIYAELCDDLIFGLILQIHRASKLGYLFYLQPEASNDAKFEIFESNDVIGAFSHLNADVNMSNKSQTGRGANSATGSNNSTNNNSSYNSINKYECVCPSCDRSVAALRFAPHLEKCMGMGRNSSRIATRRIANYAGDELDQLIEASGYIPNYSSNNNNTKNNSNVVDQKIINESGTSQTKLEYSQLLMNTDSKTDDLISIINSVATASNEKNNSKGPTAKKQRTKKIPSGPSPIPLFDVNSTSNSNNEDTTSQESELVKLSAASGFSTTYSSVSISPSPNSSSSASSSLSSVLSSNNTLTQCANVFVEPSNDVFPIPANKTYTTPTN